MGWDSHSGEMSDIADFAKPSDASLMELTGLESVALDCKAEQAAQMRWDHLTKPKGSLGRLEELGKRLAAVTGKVPPPFERKVIFTVAADHGVVEEGVSAFPQSVTSQMVENFVRGKAAINVLARLVGAEVKVVDAGVTGYPTGKPPEGVIVCAVRSGTGNIVKEPAMTHAQAEEIVRAGIRIFQREYTRQPIHAVGLGEMGIGNTTAASALLAALTGLPVGDVTGYGTGITEQARRHKIRVIEEALMKHRPHPDHPFDCLAKVGGLELGCLAGITLAACEKRVPVFLDGFIASVAAFLAERMRPGIRSFFIASHRSMEPGHSRVLERMDLVPLLDMGLRLGEGTGAALGLFLAEASVRLMKEMATFEEASVDRANASE
jgi:nicotinate-nucleotide--dimethylbenzimidazole phosphoribosyltransferase